MDTTGDAHKRVNSPFYRNKKGQFISKPKKRWLDNVKERGSKRKRPRDVYMSTLKGRRIVELATLAEELWCTKCNIGLSLRDTVSETHHCFASTLEVTCRVCDTHYKINTCKPFKKESGKSTYPINGQIVVGMYNIGIGPHKLNDFLSCSDIPTANPSLLKKYEDEMVNIIYQCAKESFEQATEAEKLATIAANKIEKVVKARTSLHEKYKRVDMDEANRPTTEKINLFKQSTAMSEAENQIEETKTENESALECRACLQIMNADCVLYNIFEGWTPPWDGMENSIAEDLAKIANIQISESDRHSKIICETCCQLLLSACSFTAVVKKNDEILQQRYREDTTGLNLSNDRVWPKPIQVDKSIASSMYENVDIKQEILSDEEHEYPTANGPYNMSTDEIPNLDIIKIEPEEIIQQQPLQVHVAVNGNEELDHSSTEETHLTNGNSDNGEHLISEIKEEPLSDEDDTDIHSDLPLECLLCAKAFNSVSGLKAHVIAQHSYRSVKRKRLNSLSPEKIECKYICAICRRTFTTSTDLMVHETCHNRSVCYGCNESFDTFTQLTIHRRTCKAIASKEVTKLKTLDDVLRPQSKEQVNTLKCTLCNETFTDIYYMNIHQEIHHSNSEENEDKN